MDTKQEKRFAVVGQGTIFDGIAYWAILIGVYLMVGGLMFYSGKEKLFDDNGNAPQAIKTQFAGTFIDTFPRRRRGVGDPGDLRVRRLRPPRRKRAPARVPAAPRELGVAVRSRRGAPCLRLSRVRPAATHQFSGTASLYTYFGSTVVILILVSMLPPNRPDRWLSGVGPEMTRMRD